MAGFLPGAPKTPVKILRSSLHDLCRVCNVNLRTSGQGKFNLFEGEATKKQNVAARLSSVLGFPVEKEHDASSRLCFKCRREMEKLETLNECLENFRKKALQSLQDQRNLFESGLQERRKRCHRSSPSSPIRKRAVQKSPFRSSQRQILKPVGSKTQNTLAELPCHEELIIPVKPKKITSSVEVGVKIVVNIVSFDLYACCHFNPN